MTFPDTPAPTGPRQRARVPITGNPSVAGVYAAVGGLWAITSAPNAWDAVVTFMGLCGVDLPHPGPFLYSLAFLACIAAALAWLHALWTRQPPAIGGRTLHAAGHALTLSYAIAIFAVWAVPGSWPVLSVITSVSQAAMMVMLSIALCASYGLTPGGWGLPVRPQRRLWDKQDTSVAFYALFLCGLAGPVYLLCTMLPGPIQRVDQTTAQAAGGLAPFVAQMLWSSVIEEMIVTAATVALLSLARRPTWEILLVVGVLRMIPHLYFGMPALAMAALGAGMAMLYRRYRRVLPLIIGHAVFDVRSIMSWMQMLWVVAAVATCTTVVSKRRRRP